VGLFQHVPEGITLSSGQESTFKIDCDFLSPRDWGCIAHLLVQRLPEFCAVHGVMTGGVFLQEAMEQYIKPDARYHLIVDDVLTTGDSMFAERHFYCNEHEVSEDQVMGAVAFLRGHTVPGWIFPLLVLNLTASRMWIPHHD
jgi:orotate phosphoribosyltransferase